MENLLEKLWINSPALKYSQVKATNKNETSGCHSSYRFLYG